MNVDVIVTATDRPGDLAESLRYLRHQTHEAWRAIVAEPGLAEGTREAVAAFNKEAGREAAIVVESPQRAAPACCNAGLAAGEGGYVLFLRAGDLVLRRGLERLVATAEAGGYGAASGAVATAVEGQRTGRATSAHAAAFGLKEMLDGYEPPLCGVLMARSLLEGKKFGVNLGALSALDLLLRVAEGGIRWRSCPAVVTLHAREAPSGSAGAWPALATLAEGVLRRSYRRAAAHGWDEQELTEAREERAVAAWRLAIATLAALEERDERMSTATELMRPVAREGGVDAVSAAEAALWALRHASGVRPVIDGRSEAAWAPSLAKWWSRCVSERWASNALPADGLAALAEVATPDEAVAASVLEQLGMPGVLLIAGAGEASFALADAAAAKGWDVRLVLPAAARAVAALAAASGERFAVVGPERAAEHRDPLVITPEDESTGLELSAGRPNVIRWSGTRRKVVEQATARLRGSWGGRG